jgi:Helix-turn-helix domain
MRINPYKTQLGSFLPNGIMKLTSIGSTAKLIYGRLCQYAGEKGYCWPAISTLADAIGCSKTTVKKAIKELQDANLIEVEHRYSEDGDATSNLYYFLDHDALHIHPLGGGQDSAPPQSVSVLPRSATARKENHLRETKNLKSSSNTHAHKKFAAAPKKTDYPPLPLDIEAVIKSCALGQAHLSQVRLLTIKKLNSGICEPDVLACLSVFNQRLPRLRNIDNPCSLLFELFRGEVGKEHLEIIEELVAKSQIAVQEKALKKAHDAAKEARLTLEAIEWVHSKEGQKFIENPGYSMFNNQQTDVAI